MGNERKIRAEHMHCNGGIYKGIRIRGNRNTRILGYWNMPMPFPMSDTDMGCVMNSFTSHSHSRVAAFFWLGLFNHIPELSMAHLARPAHPLPNISQFAALSFPDSALHTIRILLSYCWPRIRQNVCVPDNGTILLNAGKQILNVLLKYFVNEHFEWGVE